MSTQTMPICIGCKLPYYGLDNGFGPLCGNCRVMGSPLDNAKEVRRPDLPLRKDDLLNAYKLGQEDRLTLHDLLYQHAVKTYEETLRQEAKLVRRSTSGIMLHDPQEIAFIQARADMASSSIVNTFNSGLEKEIDRLIAADYKANRKVIARRLRSWWDEKTAYQQSMVATTETFEIATRARGQFYERNNIAVEAYFGGSETCPICKDIAGGNPHTLDEMMQIGVPHVQCLDWWSIEPGDVPTDEQLWLGQ